MTRVVVARSSWETIVRELDRVAPREGVLLPLVGIEHRADPCASIGLCDIATVVLAEARSVPAHLQDNSLVHVAALPTSDAWADEVVLSLVRRSPRLRAAAYLHSHPFAIERTSPSHGDIHGHMRPLLARNADAGLFASFSFIACRTIRATWRLPCFAMDARERVSELGNAEIVDDSDEIVRRARAPRASRSLLRRWRSSLRARGFSVRVDELFGGWSRIRVPLGADRVLVALFPIDFPASPPRYHLVDTRARHVERLERAFALDASEVAI